MSKFGSFSDASILNFDPKNLRLVCVTKFDPMFGQTFVFKVPRQSQDTPPFPQAKMRRDSRVVHQRFIDSNKNR